MKAGFKNALLIWSVLFWALFGVAAYADKRVALVVGNSAYARVTRLANPENDAQDLSEMLRSLNFDVIFKANVDRRGLDAALEEFERKAQGADTALFFFAGHGLQYRGQNYLLPVDADLEDEVSLKYNTLAIEKVREALDSANGVKIMILDACRNNPLSAKLVTRTAGLSRSVELTRGLARLDRTEGMVVAYATQADQVAQDGTGRNSPFSSALIRRLNEPNLEIATLFRRVAQDVYEQTGGKQRPELSISLLQDFYLNLHDDDSRVWRRIGPNATEAELKEFVNRFPNSPYVRDAQNRIYVIESARRERDEMSERIARLEAERLQFQKRESERLAAEQREKEKRDKDRADLERLAIDRQNRERQEAERREAERLAKEKLEQEQLEKARVAAEKLENERREAARLAAEKLEKQRLAAEKREQERQEAVRLAAEEQEKQRQEAEKLAQERREKERLANERREQERLAAERIAAEKLEKQRLAAEKREQEHQEALRLAAEQQEKQRQEVEKLARERQEKERLAIDQRERERLAAERIAAVKKEQERIAAAKREADEQEALRLAAEQKEQQRQEVERLAQERKEKERLANDQRERERLAAERVAAEKKEQERMAAAKREAELQEQKRLTEQKLEAERLEKVKARLAALEVENRQKAEAEAAKQKQAETCARETADFNRLAGESQKSGLEQMKPQVTCPGLVASIDKAIAKILKAQEQACIDENRALRKIGDSDLSALKVFVIGATCDAARKTASDKAEKIEAQIAKAEAACASEGDRLAAIKAENVERNQIYSELTALQKQMSCDKLRPSVTAAAKEFAPVEPSVDTPDQIKTAQVELKRIGCYSGDISGALSKTTRAAVESYYRAQGTSDRRVSIDDQLLGELKGQPVTVCAPPEAPIAERPAQPEPPVAARPKHHAPAVVRQEPDQEPAPRHRAKPVQVERERPAPVKHVAAPRPARPVAARPTGPTAAAPHSSSSGFSGIGY